MSCPTEMADRHARMLGELAELGLTLAREVHGRAAAAESAEDVQGLSLAFHRVSRCVRMTLALEARLERDRRQGVKDEADAAAQQARGIVSTRKAQVRAAVTRAVMSEREEEEAEPLLFAIEDRIDEASLYEGFLGEPVGAQILRLCAELGVAAPDLGPAAPSPPQSPEGVERRGPKGALPSGVGRAGTCGRGAGGGGAYEPPAFQPTTSP